MSQYGSQSARYGQQDPSGGRPFEQEQDRLQYPETETNDQDRYASQSARSQDADRYSQGYQNQNNQEGVEQYNEEEFTSTTHTSQVQQTHRGQTPNLRAQSDGPNPLDPYAQVPRSAQQSVIERPQPNASNSSAASSPAGTSRVPQNAETQGSCGAQSAISPAPSHHSPTCQPDINANQPSIYNPVVPTNGPMAPMNCPVAPTNPPPQQNWGTGRNYHKTHHNALYHMSATAKLGFTRDHMDSFLHLGTYALGALANTHGLAPEKGHHEGQEY